MTWALAKKILCNCTSSILKSEDNDFRISCIMPPVFLRAVTASALIYGTVAELSPWLSCQKPCCVLVLATSEEELPDIWGIHPNIARVYTAAALSDCIATLSEAMRESELIEAGHSRMLQMLSVGTTLNELVDAIATLYGHYCDVLDNALNILAFSEHTVPPTDDLPTEHTHGYIKSNVLRYLRDSGTLRQMEQPVPTRVLDPERNTYCYSVPVQASPTLKIGYLCIFIRADETFSLTHLHYLPETAKLVSVAMQGDRFYTTNKAVYFTRLLNDILTNIVPNEASYEERFLVFSYHLRRWKNIIVLHLGADIWAVHGINALSEQLRSVFGNSVFLIQEDYLIYLTSRADHTTVPENQLESWETALSSLGLEAGISSTFENILAASSHLEQAKRALSLGPRIEHHKRTHLYDQLCIADLLSRVAPERALKSFCYPPLLRLIEWDSHNQSAGLLKTLRCYLENNQSIVQTCKALFIHRNTLYYRLEKLQAVMECDLGDPSIIYQIAFSFSILRYLGEDL